MKIHRSSTRIAILLLFAQLFLNSLAAAIAGAKPGGSNTQVQYNHAGAFGGVVNAISTDGITLTLISPKIAASLLDSNGNIMLALIPFSAAVNHFAVANRESTQWRLLYLRRGRTTTLALH